MRGHTNTITGAMYNCKDEHLASISLNGDLILHNLASGAKAAELKDPNEQVVYVLSAGFFSSVYDLESLAFKLIVCLMVLKSRY